MLIVVEHDIEAKCEECGEDLILTDEMGGIIYVLPCKNCMNNAYQKGWSHNGNNT